MKNIILTIDYELFFGNKSGTVKECMIDKTQKLASLLDINDSKMTVFWDILHYYTLLKLENKHPELKPDRLIIKEQVQELAKRGHDIQLHLHPHWLDTTYENGKWTFKYDRFSLDDLSNENDPGNINTIIGCVTQSTMLIEDVVSEVIPGYKVNSFRAGGYLVEPFEKIGSSLAKNGIFIDSSVSPDTEYSHDIFSYSFKGYPKTTDYKFALSPRTISGSGPFTEIPVASVPIPTYLDIYYKYLRRKKYPAIENERGGEGTYHSFYKKSKIKRAVEILFKKNVLMFSTDTNFEERFAFMYGKVPDSATMILHPKLLNKHSFELLEKYISSKKIRFLSITQFLSLNNSRK